MEPVKDNAARTDLSTGNEYPIRGNRQGRKVAGDGLKSRESKIGNRETFENGDEERVTSDG
jgi:hypothetical protein